MALAIGLVLLLLVLLVAPWLLLLLDAPLWAPIAIDLVVLGSAAALALTRWALMRRKAGKLERALPSAKPGPVGRPDAQAEVDEIRRELDAAIGTIAQSRLGGGGRGAVMALPWYAVVGAPGCGKSTLLRGSGLPFPSAPRDGRSAASLGGTRRCDVWLGNDAVLLDTAGRWSIADDDTEWAAFLERLAKHRGKRALDGVLLGVAVDHLSRATEVERSTLARQLRTRIESLSTRLGVGVPVYVVVTKCDRWVGFSETFAALDKRERARPWGFTLEARARTEGIEDVVRGELETLVGTLRARVLATLANERRVEARGVIAELPAHVESLIEPLSSFLAQVFVASVYGETPTLRGVYFTSSTQEGRPLDRLLASSLRTTGIDAHPLPESTLEPRAYFVHQVLTRVVFADAETAAPSTKAKRRRMVVQTAIGASLAALAAALTITTAFSWQANRRAIDALAAALAPSSTAGEIATPRSLAPLRAQLAALRDEIDRGPPISMRWGLYGGDVRADVARRRYVQALRRAVLDPLLAREATELTGWGAVFERELDREPSDEERGRALALLDRQLRFASPIEPGEPPLTDEGRARVAASLATAWCAAVNVETSECLPHAALLLEATTVETRPRVARHDDAIRLARLGLARTHADRAALDALVQAAAGRGYDLTLARMVGSTGRALVSEGHVRGAFTRRGWDEVVRARIEHADGDAERAWVLGTRASATTPAAREALRRAYFEAYADEWRAFLSSVRVTTPGDATEALALLEDMTRGTPPPLGRLLATVDANAHLDVAASQTGGPRGLLDTLTTHLTSGRMDAAAPVEAPADPSVTIVSRALAPYTSFAVRSETTPEDAPLGVDVYRDELSLLRDALATYRDDASAAGALETRLVAARRRVDGLVTEQAAGARDFFERVLRPPVESAAVTSSRAMAGAVASSFCASVSAPYAASIAGHYPFAPHGDDAPLGEVTAFYRPGGTLWTYYDASLASIAPRAGSHFTLAHRLDHDGVSPYATSLPAFLERSQVITSGLFPPGSAEPRIELDVRIHPTPGAASVRLSVGGATIDYRNGPETWSRIVWPGATPAAGARLEVESARGLSERITEDGEWGLFRLVEAAAQVESRPGERTHTARWHLPGHDVDVVVDLRSVRTECALFDDDRRGRPLGSLRAAGVSAPRRITRGGTECAL